MSATVEPVTESDRVLDEMNELPDARVLEDKTPEWIRMTGTSVTFVAALGLLMITMFASRPLWPTDLWDHINYGNWIMNQQRLPLTEPLLPLADGIPMTTSAWLSQVGLASLYNASGFAGLQFAFGLSVVLSLGIVAWGGVRRSGSAVAGFVAVFVFLALNWHQFQIIRPQLAGVLFFSALTTWLLTVRAWHRALWLLVPGSFAVWANMHGSFAVGLAALLVAAAGHGLSVLMRTRSLRQAVANPRFIRLTLLTQLSATAALLNPGGIAIFAEVLRVGQHPNIDSMFEWDPLTLRSQQGQMLAAISVVLMVVLRCSPRRLRTDEVLLLMLTGGMTLWSSRMMNWLAPVMALTLAAHGTATWRLLRKSARQHDVVRRTGLWTIVNLGLIWIFFAFTTLGVQAVHGRPMPLEKAVSSQTPVSTAEFLNSEASLPEGVVFCPAEWSGFLMKFGPDDFRPMVNLHVHVIPEAIWNHYEQVAAGPSDWSSLTDLYGINLMITSKKRNARLIRRIRKEYGWEPVFEDAQAVVFQRWHSVHDVPTATK